ncbi:MAG: hypothetical protein Kow0042_17510 [Calditrichia bacterium]
METMKEDFKNARTRKMLRPGQPGTKKLSQKFGADLVCVRYRYDATQKKRYTTVEVVIDEAPWNPQKREKIKKTV